MYAQAARAPRCIHMLALLLVIGALVLSACGAGTAVAPVATAMPSPSPEAGLPDYWPTTGWRASTPEAQGMDSAQILAALQYADTAHLNLRSLTVVRNGYIVFDAYAQPFTADQAAPVMSVTKSVIAVLVGIALHDGALTSTREPVLGLFPDRQVSDPSPDKAAMTIEDLLTMRSGLACDDATMGETLRGSQDWVRTTLDLPMAARPGTTFNYCTLSTHLLSAILTRATGMSTQAYAQDRLFGPLGIQPADYTWETDPQGIPIGGYGLALRPRDMAKLGLLLDAGGRWDGAQVVPADWIATATRAHARTASGQDYGYLFWVYPSDFSAEGHGDQRIMVVPDKDLVVVTTAAHEDPTGRATQQRMLTDFLIPAATAHSPLPPNDAARGALQAKAETLADPARPVPRLPSTAALISGKRFQFPDNDSGWKALTATFTQGSSTAQVTIATTTGVEQVQVGLDNVYRLIPRPDGTIALRGRWTNDHTFVVHQLVVGDISEFDISLEFHDNQVAVHAEESVFHQNSFDVTGTAE